MRYRLRTLLILLAVLPPLLAGGWLVGKAWIEERVRAAAAKKDYRTVNDFLDDKPPNSPRANSGIP